MRRLLCLCIKYKRAEVSSYIYFFEPSAINILEQTSLEPNTANMQFFNAIVFALVGAAVALPNAAPNAEANVIEKRVREFRRQIP